VHLLLRLWVVQHVEKGPEERGGRRLDAREKEVDEDVCEGVGAVAAVKGGRGVWGAIHQLLSIILK
jgi:hypothetical protein